MRKLIRKFAAWLYRASGQQEKADTDTDRAEFHETATRILVAMIDPHCYGGDDEEGRKFRAQQASAAAEYAAYIAVAASNEYDYMQEREDEKGGEQWK